MPDRPPTPTVLVVDDDQDIADLIAASLAPEYDVNVAYCGEAALEIREETPVDVVLLDRMLPDISGDKVLVTLRDWGIDARVGMISAKDPETDILDLGFDDYLVKPVDHDTLQATVERLLTIRSYDDVQRELSELRVKRNVLKTELPVAQLAANDRYQRLLTRIEKLEAQEETYRTQDSEPAPGTF